MDGATGETVELLQTLIRNECVNLNTPESGQEHRSVAVLQEYFANSGLETQVYEPAPGRQSFLAKLPGRDAAAPSLMLMGHLDVVPVNAKQWTHDPFGGELIDDFVWGRGAIDMLNLTTTMAVATRQLADSGFRPNGDLLFLAVADEESGGELGAGWLTQNAADDVRCTYALSEWGGVPIPSATGQKLWITVGQKGGLDVRITVRGTSGHASMPFGSDNALIKAAKIVTDIDQSRLAPEITDVWRSYVEGMQYDAELTAALLDPSQIDAALTQLSPGLAKRAHACTRTTMSPTVISGGIKSNVIPDEITFSVNIRYLPGYNQADVMKILDDIVGELRADVDYSVRINVPPTSSRVDSALWTSLDKVAKSLVADSTCVPALTAGGNDLGYLRELGTTAYGFGLMSNQITIENFFSMFHGADERVDLESLRLSTALWADVARDLLS